MSHPHQPTAINLDGLQFEELGQSPIATQGPDTSDNAEHRVPAPHGARCGKKGDRELLSRSFEEFV